MPAETPQERNNNIHLVVKIVSCRDLLAGDRTGLSDPYVKVKLGSKELHRTSKIMKTLNPVFDESLNNTFTLNCPYQKLVDAGGLELDIKDWDAFGSNDRLGSVVISPTEFLKNEVQEYRREYAITPPPLAKKQQQHSKGSRTDAGFITISFCSHHNNNNNTTPNHTTTTTPQRRATRELPDQDLTTITTTAKKLMTVSSLTMNDEDFVIPDDKELFIEIVSCRNLLAADKTGLSDPYVKVKMEKKDLHTTKHVRNTVNPSFSKQDHNNRFILTCPASDLFQAGGLTFKVKDWDRIGSNDDLGAVIVPAPTLYCCLEKEEQEFKILPPKGHGEDAGFITIRWRRATLGDKEDWKHDHGLLAKVGINSKTAENYYYSPDKADTIDIMKCIDKEDKMFRIEIVSCTDLLAADKTGLSDPYVKVQLGGKTVHETKPLHKTVNPVFTKDQKNSFVLNVPAMELFQKKGLEFKIKDHDSLVGLLKKDEVLGSVFVSADELYNHLELLQVVVEQGEEEEVKLKTYTIDPPSGKSDAAGSLTLKITEASEQDAAAAASGSSSKSRSSFLSRALNSPRSLVGSSNTTANPGDDDVTLLMEIISCQNLPKADLYSSDPYVKIKLDGKDVHKTGHIANSLNPIYTIQHDSLFVFHINEEEFKNESKSSQMMTFKVKDYDKVSKNDDLGTVVVSGRTIWEQATTNGGAERMVLNLTTTPPCDDNDDKKKQKQNALLNIRCRIATAYDLKFMDFLAKHKKDPKVGFLTVEQQMDILMNPTKQLLSSNTTTTNSTVRLIPKLRKETNSMEDNGVEKFRIRPYPNPNLPAQTKWLSHDEIQNETFGTPSTSWIAIGSPESDLGLYAFVEILGCDGLPNLDKSVVTGNSKRNKTDAFCLIVCENSCAKTDVIDDCLNPRWLPWMQRAFRIALNHSSSDIFLGVFDHDEGIASGNSHDMIGRVPIELSSMVPNTEYVLTFPLYQDTMVKDRKSYGTITVRVRVELRESSCRDVVLSSLVCCYPPPVSLLHVKHKKDYKIIRQTVRGSTDYKAYSLSTLNLYIEELTSYLYVQYYLIDAVESLLFWRGHVPLPPFGIKIPLHSAIAFIMAITMAENPCLGFAYSWFLNAWLLLAIQTWRSTVIPNVWCKTKSFSQILRMLVLNTPLTKPERIPPHCREEEAVSYMKEMEERIERAEAAAAKRQEEQLRLLAQHEKEMAELDAGDVVDPDATNNGGAAGLGLNPLKKILYPVQQICAQVCTAVRFVRNVYLWDEPYLAFFVTLGSLVLGCICLVTPWSFLIRWTSRLFAWGIFGPHMKLVDVFYYSKLQQQQQKPSKTTEEDDDDVQNNYKEKFAERLNIQRQQAQQTKQVAFEQTEQAKKMRSMKELLFGKFIMRIPAFHTERYREFPMFSSYCEPHNNKKNTEMKMTRLGGQTLVGTMIPQLKEFDDQKQKKEIASSSSSTKKDKDI